MIQYFKNHMVLQDPLSNYLSTEISFHPLVIYIMAFVLKYSRKLGLSGLKGKDLYKKYEEDLVSLPCSLIFPNY